MPIYQFWCEDCHDPYEILMTVADKEKLEKGYKKWVAKTECPTCSKPMKNLIAPVHLSSRRECL